LIAQDFQQNTRARWVARFTLCAGIGCLAIGQPAAAVVTYNPFATIDVQHSSNVFSLPDKQVLFPGSHFEDTITHYIAGGTAEFAWGHDTLALNAQGGRYQYAQNDQLSHYESKFGALLDWRLNPVVSGQFAFEQGRTMSAPGDTLAQQLEIQTDRTLSGTVKILLTPRWRFDLSPQLHILDSPLPLYPDFGYRESSYAAALLYLGIQKLTVGVRGSYLEGNFFHIVDATRYNQKTAELTSNYAVTKFSSFDLQLGYTWRGASLLNSADAADVGGGPAGTTGNTKAFTGSLGLSRRLTVKTGLNLRVFREVDSYAAGANPDIGTGGEVSLKWDPDFRFSVGLRYRLVHESIQGKLAIADDFAGRSDKINEGELSIKYQALRWLSVRPYAMRFSRSSNLHRASYNNTVVGIDFSAQLHPNKQ
jgi:hypothetical protein